MPKTRAQTARVEGLRHVNGDVVNLNEWQQRDAVLLASSVDEEKIAPRKRPAPQKSRRRRCKIGPEAGDEPPVYQIDLSRPPEERYVEVATVFQRPMRSLTGLFDEVVGGGLQFSERGMAAYLRSIHFMAKLLLRRLPDNEQKRELRGISRATGIDMYLLICFNTLLDLFMGCSSGGIRTRCNDGALRMLHYRTLDWGMDGLRELVVQLEFVNKPHGQVIARSVTYAGFVGVLTAVRPGLSASLNFRACHNGSDSRISNIKFYGHLLLVLLGLRPSIASHLRSYFLPSTRRPGRDLPNLDQLLTRLPSTPTTAAYIILSDGTSTSILEKDRVTAQARSSTSFVAATNHDVSSEADSSGDDGQPPETSRTTQVTGMQELVEESVERKQCIEREWQNHVDRMKRRTPGLAEDQIAVKEESLIKMIQKWPITNECTHFACVMDPTKGEILWCRRWKEPVLEPISSR